MNSDFKNFFDATWFNTGMPYPYFFCLAYVGDGYRGWQIQSDVKTVQGELWSSLRKIWMGAPMPQGAGRTDTGVHANAQGVIVWMHKQWESHRLLAAVNAHLPDDIRVVAVQPAPSGFFPRHHATAKRYVYKLDEGAYANPFLDNRRWHLFGARPIDKDEVLRAGSFLVGTHDFSCFRCAECSANTAVRTIFDFRLVTRGRETDLIFEGDKFLMHQVRIMVGTLVGVGRGKIISDRLPEIISSKDRSQAGVTAPPEGLYLDKVWYSAEWGIGDPYTIRER